MPLALCVCVCARACVCIGVCVYVCEFALFEYVLNLIDKVLTGEQKLLPAFLECTIS